MKGGQVVNYLKKLLPHPNNSRLDTKFKETRPRNEKDLEDQEAEFHSDEQEKRDSEFRKKYVKTNLADFEKTLAAHD